MADETNVTQGQQEPTSAAPAGAENTGREPMIPRARFDDVLARAKDAEAALEQLQREQADLRELELAEQQRWQDLAEERGARLTELETKAARVDEVETTLRELVAAQVEGLPEAVRGLVPDFADPRQTLQWLTQNAALLSRPAAPQLDAGAGGLSGPPGARPVALSDLEQQVARAAGMTPEQYAEYREKGSPRPTQQESDVVRDLRERGALS